MNIDRDLVRSNSMQSALEILQTLRAEYPAAFAAAKVVGRWVWITFDAKPNQETRDGLRQLGFRWNRKREAWQHCGGYPSRHSPGDPRFKYGQLSAAALLSDDKEVVA